MANRKNQYDRLLQYMRTHKGITGKEAMEKLSIMNFKARICELRQMGYRIVDEWEVKPNKYGDPTRFKRYFLIEEVVA